MKYILAACATFAAMLALPAQANTVYRPGLTQVLFKQGSANGFPSAVSGVPVLASNIVEKASADSYADGPERVPYPLMDRDNNVVNPLTGTTWAWPTQYGIFAYEGEMYVEQGTTYTFYGRFDDGSAIVVDGTTVLMQQQDSGYNKQPQVWGDWTATRTEWVPFNAWIWDWTGGKAVKDCYYALQYNTASVKNDFGNAAKWFRFNETGDMSFLRTRVDEAYTTVANPVEDGDDFQIALTFSNLPSDADITFCYGDFDAGMSLGAWENAVLAGRVTSNETSRVFTLVGAKGANVLRVYVKSSVSTAAGGFVEWTEPIALASSPIVALESVTPSYTNASFSVRLNGYGVGAASASLRIEVAATEDGFDSPLIVIPYAGNPVSNLGTYSIAGSGFVTNTTYFARAVATNNNNAEGHSAPLSFTMLSPGSPTVVMTPNAAGFSAIDCTAVVSDFGVGAESSTIWLDVSKAGDFSDTVVFGGLPAFTVPTTVALSATGLGGATVYAARARAVNDWGLESVSEVFPVATRAEPIDATGASSVSSAAGVQTLSVSVSDVEPGSTYSVALAVDGVAVKAWDAQSAPDTFSFDWEGDAGTAHNAVFTITSSLGGQDWVSSRAVNFTVGETVAVLGSVSALDSMVFRVGDRVVLPALEWGESIAYDTNVVVSLSGATFTALEPGASRVRRFATDLVTGVATEAESGVMIVAPRDEDLNGAGLFVNRTAANGTINWCNASSWQKISGPDGKDWPDGPGDVALIYLPLTQYTVTVNLGNNAVTVGHLGLGSTHSGNQIYLSNGTLTFQTGDGSESWLRMAGRNEGAGNLTIGASIVLANDLVVDGMGVKDMGLVFNGALDVGPYVFKTDRVPSRSPGDRYSAGQIQFNGDVLGSGEIVLRADSTASLGGFPSRKSFTGVWNPAACNHNGNYGGSALFLGNAYLGYASSELKVSGAWIADKNNRKGASVRTGWSNSYQFTAPTNFWRGGVMPPKVTLDGGELNLITQGPLDGKYQNEVREDWYEIGEFRLAAGPMGHLWSGISTWHNGVYPNTHTVITNLVAEAGATAAFGLDMSSDRGFGIISNDFHIVNSPAAAWDSGKGYEILPFFFVNAESTDRTVVVRETATGRVTKVTPDSTASSTGNIREIGSNGKNGAMEDGSTWEAVTVFPWAYAYFSQPNSTVRILSGYLNVVAKPFAPTDHDNSASSTVDFGNRTAYVYVNNQTDTTDIGCRVAGTAGFVKSAGGTLQLHQPMDRLFGGVWVGAGRLSLLDDATLGDNDVSVAAGAKLRIAGVSPFGRDARLDLEDRDWISTNSRVELDNGAENRVRRLYVNGVSQKRGTYGATGSGAEFIDDKHFSGTGVLKVLRDDLANPLVIRLK